MPPAEERRERLGSVLSVIYVIFTEGSSATAGSALIRTDLAREAIRQARMLARLVPDEPEVHGLLALLELTAARFPARLDARRRAGAARGPGPPALGPVRDPCGAGPRWRSPAASVAVSGRTASRQRSRSATPSAASVAATDWDRIVVLYEALGRLAPSPVVDLNRAVAVSMADGPAAALPIVDELILDGRLAGSHLLPTVRGELLSRLGRTAEARAELEVAVRLCRSEPERRVLERKRAALDG